MKSTSLVIIITILLLSFMFSNKLAAQSSNNYMRLAKIVVDSTQLAAYKAALKAQMESALKLEKGVLAYAAVQDKNNPTQIIILETYASVAAYETHTQAPHFKKYKATVEKMVKSLELIEAEPILIEENKILK